MHTIKKAANVTTVIVFVVAFLLGYGTSARIVNRNRAGNMDVPKTAGADAASSLADIASATAESSGANAIAAGDQPAGDAVAVEVNTDKTAWAVVHEDRAGKPGNILGAQLFPAGKHLSTIALLRGTEAGKKYYVMLHADDGDRAFDYTQDQPMTNESEDPIIDVFTAIASPAR